MFDGIVRSDGRIGTRNFIGVMTTVSCASSVSQFIVESFPEKTISEFSNIDGIISLCHDTGCGMSPDVEGFSLLQRTMAGYARHPNFGGILFVGLECEVNQISCLLGNMNLPTGGFLRTLNIQTASGANMVCFTTGRGTVCGFKPVPTIKIASNTDMYNIMIRC
jgi:altronate dehydratase